MLGTEPNLDSVDLLVRGEQKRAWVRASVFWLHLADLLQSLHIFKSLFFGINSSKVELQPGNRVVCPNTNLDLLRPILLPVLVCQAVLKLGVINLVSELSVVQARRPTTTLLLGESSSKQKEDFHLN